MSKTVEMTTSAGTIRIELDDVKAGHYDGLIFHRVISTFMIQGGG